MAVSGNNKEAYDNQNRNGDLRSLSSNNEEQNASSETDISGNGPEESNVQGTPLDKWVKKPDVKPADIEATVEVPSEGKSESGGGLFDEPMMLIIGAALIGAIIFFFVALVLHGRNRKKRKQMDEDKTFEPYRNGSTDMAVKVLLDDPKAPVKIGRVHDAGRRSMQQDSFGVSDTEDISSLDKKGVMAVVADGMGGLSDGERMSQMVVVKMLQGFDESPEDAIPSSTLLGLVGEANDAVNEELGPERIGKCGSTVVAVILKNNRLSWISVGDSHIYVYRKGQLVKLNTDHNYGTQLDNMVKNGEISFEEASTDPQRAALTSFIGIGELELIDQNETPIAIEKGDRILLMSDGIYGTVDERAMTEMMALPFRKALSALDRAVCAREKNNQDNYTCVMLEVN